LAAASLAATTPLVSLGSGTYWPACPAAVLTIAPIANNTAMTKMTNTIFRLPDIVGLLGK
jgi:hypothetical protein